MTNVMRVKQEVQEGKLIYSLDVYADYGILEIFSDTIDAGALQQSLIKEFKLKDIITKELFDGKRSIIAGDSPDKISVIENDFKFLVQLKQDFPGLSVSLKLLRELVKEYSVNKDVLDLVGSFGTTSLYAAKGKAKSVSIVEKDSKHIQKIKKNFEINDLDLPQLWESDFLEFIDLAIESKSKWDLIILDLTTVNLNRLKNFDLKEDHRDLIKRIQAKLLTDAGFLIFITDDNSFALDPYIRPGADKLTNKMIPEEFEPLKPNQIFAFYN